MQARRRRQRGSEALRAGRGPRPAQPDRRRPSRQQDEDALREDARERSLGLTRRRRRRRARRGARRGTASPPRRPSSTHTVLSECRAQSDAQSPAASRAGYFAPVLAAGRAGAARSAPSDEAIASSAVAVLGHQAAADPVSEGRSAVGGLVKVNHAWLEVIGVLADRDLGQDQFRGRAARPRRATVSTCRWRVGAARVSASSRMEDESR
jgi:hypothetical protein